MALEVNGSGEAVCSAAEEIPQAWTQAATAQALIWPGASYVSRVFFWLSSSLLLHFARTNTLVR